ncbi:3-isopropylmalate dehydratase small subunit [Desulfopila sp. IMCC35008]|uniref:3-isopropylmalate dehydratase small subunit n=1 Tax=Desulfopila sp. IMCC35008 TaxID=2653858 RepID=UPI0013D12A4D|nr:3-isopropylmalate dehydratase small subunit [Desulfopila sp. IMCC35008]
MNNSSQIKAVSGRAVPLPGNDIDTDRIIPARFLRCVTFEALGEQLFWDERFDERGQPLDHPLNNPKFGGGSVLLVNGNFGCGSSREHAPQAIKRFGIKAIIGESFAEIFAGNCTNLGIPVFTTNPETVQRLMQIVESKPETILDLDLEEASVTLGGETHPLTITDSSRTALLKGSWDSLEALLQNSDRIKDTYNQLPYINGFADFSS